MGEWLWSPWLGTGTLVVLATMAIAATVTCYRGSPRRHLVLGWLRLAVLVGLLLISLQPQWVVRHETSVPPHIVVLVDTSRSMGKPAAADFDGTRLARVEKLTGLVAGTPGGVLAQLAKRGEVTVRHFDDGVGSLPDGDTLQVGGRGTALAEALDAVRGDEVRDDNFCAIVLFSDGRATTTRSARAAAARCRRQGITIHVVAMGAEDDTDRFVESLEAPELAFVGDRVTLRALVGRTGAGTEECRIELEVLFEPADGTVSQAVASQSKVLQLGAQLERVEMPLRVDREGYWTFEARISGAAPDSQPYNDTRRVKVAVVRNTLKVLFVEGRPRWEWRFLRNVMLRDPQTRQNFKAVLLSSNRVTRQPASASELIALPDATELLDYDLIILGDVKRNALTPAFAEAMRKHVENDGAGFLLIAGPRNGPAVFGDSDIADLMAVRPASVTRAVPREGLRLTGAEVADGSYFGFAAGSGAAAKWWRPISRVFAATSIKPLATPLLIAPGAGVVAAEMPIGLGLSTYFGFDETWRWRRYEDGSAHERFWRRTIARLGLPRLRLRLAADELTVSSPIVRVGDAVDIELRLATPLKLESRGAGGLVARVTAMMDAGADPIAVSLQPDPAGPRATVFRGRFRPPTEGDHEVLFRLVRDGQQRRLIAPLFVEASRDEMRYDSADGATLHAIAVAGGGLYRRAGDDLTPIATEISDIPRVSHRTERRPAISAGWVLVAVLGALLLEWGLRRHMGLR